MLVWRAIGIVMAASHLDRDDVDDQPAAAAVLVSMMLMPWPRSVHTPTAMTSPSTT